MNNWIIALLIMLAASGSSAGQRANELTLAGFRPGKDTLSSLERRFPQSLRVAHAEAERMHEWADACSGRAILAEVDAAGVVQSLTVVQRPPQPGECKTPHASFASRRNWQTGRGLALGLGCGRSIALYGIPASRGPASQGGQERELLYYEFDWAGPDVPQVMEVTCERANKQVVQITLAFPSL